MIDLIEAEIKIEVEDIEEIERRVISLGGEFIEEILEEDTYFNHPSRDFSETDEALRIRRNSKGEYSITYKGPKIDGETKSRLELSCDLKNDCIIEILEKLGFERVLTVRKRRRLFKLGEFSLALDRVEGLGSYLEVETIVDEGDFERAKRKLMELVEKLGLDPRKSIRKSYLELLLERSRSL